MDISKENQGGSGGDHWKKVPRLGLGPGAQVKSQLQKGVIEGYLPRPNDELKATGNKNEYKCNKFKAGSWNVGTLSGKGLEIAEELNKKGVTVGCLQETRWKGTAANCCRFIGQSDCKYKVFWSGNREGKHSGVAIVVADKWVDKVIGVQRIDDRLIVLDMVVGKVMCKFVSAYAPQMGCPDEQKEEFYGKLSLVLSAVKDDEFLFVGGDFNGHVGKHSDGFVKVHGGYGVGVRNTEGLRLLETCVQHDLSIVNTWFLKKRKYRHTYRSGRNKSQVDFILVRSCDKKFVEDSRAFDCVEYQHSLLVTTFKEIKLNGYHRKNFIPKRRIWLLNKRENAVKFENCIAGSWEGCADNVEDTWERYTKCVLDASDKVCGFTKANSRRKVTWWWNEEIRKVIDDKKKKFKEWEKESTNENKEAYKAAKKVAKKAVREAMEDESRKVVEEIEDGINAANGKNKLFRMARQHAKEKKDIVGGQCIMNNEGRLCVDIEDKKKVWKDYMEKLLNEENAWDGIIPDVINDGEVGEITPEEVKVALRQMKSGKACGISGVSTEMLVHSGEVGIEVLTDICNKILNGSRLPCDWTRSILVPLYKGKGDPKECGSYRGIKLLEHGMKVMERILEKRLRDKISIDEMQCGFMPGRGTVDAIFMVRQLEEKYLSRKKKLYYCFVDLEKAFDRVPRRVIEFALRKKGVEEKLVQTVMRLYEGAKTSVRVESELSESFDVKVGVHQGSVLSPFLFITVMDVLSESVREGLLFELLYADDLVLMADSMQELERKYISWKNVLERRGLRVNIGKTKVMIGDGVKSVKKSKIDPCAICGTRVCRNSIRCNKCGLWVHARCSGVKGRLLKVEKTFVCRKCENCDVTKQNENKESDKKFVEGIEVVQSFNYLGDGLQRGGGCANAVNERIRKGWLKFRELSGVLCNKRIPLKLRGVLYRTCVRTVITYGCETWPVKKENEDSLLRAERRMIRTICQVKLNEKVRFEVLQGRVGLIDDIVTVARKARLRWFGHVIRREPQQGIKRAYLYKTEGKVGRGRPRKTWYEVIRNDLKYTGVKEEEAWDRVKWRNAVRNATANPLSRGNVQYNNVR